MNRLIFGREPTLWLAGINAAIVFIGTFGFHWLSGSQAGYLVAAISALFAAATAYFVRPISPAIFTYAISAIVALAAAYGLNVTPEQGAMLNGMVVPILALLTRGQVSPTDTAFTRATTSSEKAVAEVGPPPVAAVA